MAEAMIAQMGQAALRRAGRDRRKWKKVSILLVCGLLMPLGMVVADGPGSDKMQAEELLHKSFSMKEEAGVLPAKTVCRCQIRCGLVPRCLPRGLGNAKLDQTCDVSKRWEIGRLLSTWND